MLAIRIFLIIIGGVMILSLLGYAISRDSRWLRFAGLSLKAGLALIGLLLLVLLIERLLLVV
jgi:tellurite resistance protein TehA-like permease